MCRSIKVLRKTGQPAATPEEIAAAARQFIRKVTGSRNPAKAHAPAYESAIADISGITERLLVHMEIRTKEGGAKARTEPAYVAPGATGPAVLKRPSGV